MPHADYGVSDDIEQYRRDFAKFLERIAIASEASPPPGANAANGWFIKAVNEDQEIKAVAPPRMQADDPQAEKVFAILSQFETKVLEAFSIPNHESSWDKSGKVFYDALNALKGEIKDVIKNIGGVIQWNPEAIAAFGKAIADLVKKVDNAGIVYKGSHANGHINEVILEAATRAKTSFDALWNAGGGDPLAIEFAKKCSKIMDDIIVMGQLDNDPWLQAAWQIRMQAICRMGSELLLELKVPAAPAAAAA